MAMLDEIATHLETQVVVEGSTGWTVNKGIMIESPAQIVALFEGIGFEPESDEGAANEYDFPGLQVKVRGDVFSYAAAQTQMKAVFDALHNATITDYVYLFAAAHWFPLGYDTSNRPIIAINFNAMRLRD